MAFLSFIFIFIWFWYIFFSLAVCHLLRPKYFSTFPWAKEFFDATFPWLGPPLNYANYRAGPPQSASSRPPKYTASLITVIYPWKIIWSILFLVFLYTLCHVISFICWTGIVHLRYLFVVYLFHG